MPQQWVGENLCSVSLHGTRETACFSRLASPLLREGGVQGNPKQNFWNLAAAGSRTALIFLPFVVVVVVVLCLSKGFHYVAQAASRLHLGFQSHSVLRVLTAALSIRMFQSKKTSAFGEICLYVNVDIQTKTVC